MNWSWCDLLGEDELNRLPPVTSEMSGSLKQGLKQKKIDQFKSNSIYFVTCEELSCGRRDEEVVKAVLEGGVRLIQLRDKISSKKKLWNKAVKLRQLTSDMGALLIINDHIDLAWAVEADGVHLGQDDFPVIAARKLDHLVSSNSFQSVSMLLIGLSTHNQEEIAEAITLPVDYINVGPVFSTQTKKNKYPEVGLERLKEIAGKLKRLSFPFSVMGGIKEKHLSLLDEFLEAPIAMITEISEQKDIARHVDKLLCSLKRSKKFVKMFS